MAAEMVETKVVQLAGCWAVLRAVAKVDKLGNNWAAMWDDR